MKKKHLRCLLVLLVAVCMVCSIAVPVCAEVLPSAQIGTPETALESDTEKDNTPTPTPTDTPTPEPAPSEAPSTPETSEPAATSETAAPAAPSLDEITTMLYSDLPDAPTGYYVGEYGLPVGTGQTKISLSAWQDELLDESSQGRLDADALNTDTSAMAVAKQPGQDYAIVPIVMQVEYPANGSATTVTLPDDVDLLSYASTEDHLVTARRFPRFHTWPPCCTWPSAQCKRLSSLWWPLAGSSKPLSVPGSTTCTYSSKRWHGRSQGPILAHKKKTAVLEHGGKLEILQKRPLHIFSTN